MIDEETLRQNLDDPHWRLENLYHIITKGDNPDEPGEVVLFKLNRAQKRLLARLWHRNVVLKARQMGITTFACVLWLDTALFSKSPIRCGIIAQDREAAEAIFKDKVKFAYDRLPESLREVMPLSRDSATELRFGHNDSSIRVATSMRSGTIHRLHVSELGKIASKFPDKAREVKLGSIPAVPTNGMLIVESTAEGAEGFFYDLTMQAIAVKELNRPLGQKDYRLHFFAWWEAPEYRLSAEHVVYTPAHNKYFLEIEAKISRKLSLEQRAWYVSTLESDFAGDAPSMWQEYPSFPEEAFQASTEGVWYATQLALARVQGRIVPNLPVVASPVNTFWDIGRGDMTTIWLHQRVGMENRFIRYYEASGLDLNHYTNYLQGLGLTFGTHYIPHDAGHRRMGKTAESNRTMQEMLEELMPGQRFEIVNAPSRLMHGITATRNVFSSCWFDEAGCAQGLKRLSNYRKHWDKTRGCFTETDVSDDNAHGADAFRQFGQEADNGNTFLFNRTINRSRDRPRRSAMAA